MSFVLMTVFTSFWTFFGTCVLMYVACEGIATIVKALRRKNESSYVE